MESLESLLSQAIRHAQKGKALQAAICACQVHAQCKRSYGNPANWKPGKLVRIIHIDSQGSESDLGLFREMFYRRTGARKLVRADGALTVASPTESVFIELVSGQWWLEPYHKPFHETEDTPEELVALQKRFEELMHDYDEVLDGSPA